MAKEKVVSIEDRIPKLKQARKKKANRRLIFYLSIFFFLISIIVYLQSPLSHVKTIIITGNSFYPEQEIMEQSGINPDSNIWSIQKDEIIHTLEQNSLVDKVTVEVRLPWTVEIHLIEHERVGYIVKDNLFYPILGNGAMFEGTKGQLPGDAPLLVNFSDEEVLVEMSEELGKLSNNIMNIISEIHWSPSERSRNEITLYMTDGFMVESSIRGFSEKMKVYPSIAAQLDPEVEGIIHIGVGAYFEPFNLEMTEEEEAISNENQE